MSTASSTRILVGDVCDDDGRVVKPELIGGASIVPSKPVIFFLGDLRVGVEPPDLDCSSFGVLSRSLLGELGSLLRGRPRPRLIRSSPCGLFGGSECLRPVAVALRVDVGWEDEATTISSSSSSCRGIRSLGIVKGLKKSVMFLLFFLDIFARHEARYGSGWESAGAREVEMNIELKPQYLELTCDDW